MEELTTLQVADLHIIRPCSFNMVNQELNPMQWVGKLKAATLALQIVKGGNPREAQKMTTKNQTFLVIAMMLWNTLPMDMSQNLSFLPFRKCVKAEFFKEAFKNILPLAMTHSLTH